MGFHFLLQESCRINNLLYIGQGLTSNREVRLIIFKCFFFFFLIRRDGCGGNTGVERAARGEPQWKMPPPLAAGWRGKRLEHCTEQKSWPVHLQEQEPRKTQPILETSRQKGEILAFPYSPPCHSLPAPPSWQTPTGAPRTCSPQGSV